MRLLRPDRPGAARPLPGAGPIVAALRAIGNRVPLTTGFVRKTQDRFVHALGWTAYLVLCPADAG